MTLLGGAYAQAVLLIQQSGCFATSLSDFTRQSCGVFTQNRRSWGLSNQMLFFLALQARVFTILAAGEQVPTGVLALSGKSGMPRSILVAGGAGGLAPGLGGCAYFPRESGFFLLRRILLFSVFCN
jgi:hypothetical protein